MPNKDSITITVNIALMTQPNYVVACFIIQELTETNFVSQSAVGHFSAPRLSNIWTREFEIEMSTF